MILDSTKEAGVGSEYIMERTVARSPESQESRKPCTCVETSLSKNGSGNGFILYSEFILRAVLPQIE